VMDEVREWQNQSLERLYPVVFFDALRIKIRDEGRQEQSRLSGPGSAS
jgi:transposase-like protein